ncbi:carboxypeptidase regulatory-like domain-containing protein [Mucilaginibacter sp. FT3.2]|uniref:carboxypeptidase regulatory-like domain-containing protein n=1 Tax=Mucilaginibacter sp. FT3.2 TaxID=2723090 RepID=UPI00161FA4ED|nr:carboxypeptidase regulatory-like domain-containing protein [Mucilaginibacter sp. FT3.2]MBB6233845.1 hypothetical protein [Mucilaginibacter sp. FT3.2]
MLKALLFVTLLFPIGCFAQFTITGRIINKNDNSPVANASVFLSNATTGGKTSSVGTFALHDVKPGKYDLVVSIIGFESFSQTVTVTASNISLADIEIVPKTIILKEVTIKAVDDKYRERNYDLFKDEFLGHSSLAKDCKILNPQLLDLNYDETTKMLTASSVDFLEIENSALGYKLKYLLSNFSMDDKDRNARKIHFEGHVLFEKMHGTPAQEQKWQIKRQNVYEGSIMHFLRSTLNNTLAEEGFRVLQIEKNPDAKKSRTLMHFPLNETEILQPTNQEGIYALGCDNDELHITYNKKHRFSKNAQISYLKNPNNTDVTVISFNMPYVLFDNNGGIINPNSLSFAGAWGQSRAAELLPVDYVSEAEKSNPNEQKIHTDSLAISQVPLKKDLLSITSRSDSLANANPAEKLYLQFDKPYYAIGDTIWFKAYLFNAPTEFLSAKSGILHIDITTDSGKMVKQYLIPVSNGLSWGNICLDTTNFKSGDYTLHAYTNWMRNFDNDIFYTHHFFVAGPRETRLLINTKINARDTSDKTQISCQLQFAGINKIPMAGRQFQLSVYAETKKLYKLQANTDKQGLLKMNFSLPRKSSHPFILVESTDKSKSAVIPLEVTRPENTDLQFLPEGGDLVGGLPAHIGFKALGENGKGTEISGIITDHKQKQVAIFKSSHNGIGSFDLTVKNAEIYTAKVNLPDGKIKEYLLPTVKNSGTILNVRGGFDEDSVIVSIDATNDVKQLGENFFLIGKARGIVCYAAVLNFATGKVQQAIAKRLFPSGIAHFILFTNKGRSLNERLFFIDHNDNLDIKTVYNNVIFSPRDSVTLQLNVTDKTGEPVSGNFSMSVTDDSVIKEDTLNADNIIVHLLLTGDLKGYIENPAYYFPANNKQTWQALDNLLLTQGWSSFDWPTDKQLPRFGAEKEFSIQGRVINALNNPVKKTHVQGLSRSPLVAKDTITDNDGRFVFNDFPRIDTPAFFLEAVNKSGKSFNVGIKVDEATPPHFKTAYPATTPWYINSDSQLLKFIINTDSIKDITDDFGVNNHRLKEVKIFGKKIVKGSQNLNGPGNSDMVLDEKDMLKAGKKSWLDVFLENIKGFRIVYSRELPFPYIKDRVTIFVVDGFVLEPLEEFDRSAYAYNVMNFLKSHSAEDIKGVEVNASPIHNSMYNMRFFRDNSLHDCAFVEITTRSGKGHFMDNRPGTYLYKPLPLSWPKLFYKPRYTVNSMAKTPPDLRSTIDWEPNIFTDKNGSATVSFYAADNPGTYTVIIEGTDGEGNFGYKRGKITIGKPQYQTK